MGNGYKNCLMLKIKKKLLNNWFKKFFYLFFYDVNINIMNVVVEIIYWLLSVGYFGNRKCYFVIFKKNFLCMERYDMMEIVFFIFIFCSVVF